MSDTDATVRACQTWVRMSGIVARCHLANTWFIPGWVKPCFCHEEKVKVIIKNKAFNNVFFMICRLNVHKSNTNLIRLHRSCFDFKKIIMTHLPARVVVAWWPVRCTRDDAHLVGLAPPSPLAPLEFEKLSLVLELFKKKLFSAAILNFPERTRSRFLERKFFTCACYR